MSDKNYHYEAWVLMPSFEPKQIVITGPSGFDEHFFEGKGSKYSRFYRPEEIYCSKTEAIKAGWQRIEKLQADIENRQENLNKRKTALAKASE